MTRKQLMARLTELVGGDLVHPVFTSDEQRAEFDRLMTELEALPVERRGDASAPARTEGRTNFRSSYHVGQVWSDEEDTPAAPTAPAARRSRIPMMIDQTTPVQTLRDCVADVAESLQWPCIVASGRSFQGAQGYGPLLRSESRPDLLQALRQLQELETRAIQREASDREARAQTAARDLPDPLFDQVLEILSEAQERAQRAASMEGRLDRLEQSIQALTDRVSR